MGSRSDGDPALFSVSLPMKLDIAGFDVSSICPALKCIPRRNPMARIGLVGYAREVIPPRLISGTVGARFGQDSIPSVCGSHAHNVARMARPAAVESAEPHLP